MKMYIPFFFIVISLIALPVNAAISLIAETTDSGNDDKASIIVPLDIQSGDVLITQVTFHNLNGSNGVSTPNGWTQIGLQNQNNNIFQSVYYKVATSSDVNISFEWDFDGNVNRRYILGMMAFRGVDFTSPIAANASVTGGWSWSFLQWRLNAPAVNTNNANSMLVALYTVAGDADFSPDTAMTEVYDVQTGNIIDGLTSMAALEIYPSVGSTGDRESRVSSFPSYGIGHLIALNEAPKPLVTSLFPSCTNLNTLVINFSSDLDTNSAENINNYSLLNPASNPVTISSAILSASKQQVTLTSSLNFNDLSTYNLVINNVESLSGSSIEENTTEDFVLRCELNCITDSFAGPGELSDSWSVSNSSGTFGNPTILSDGRLRLTDNTMRVATVSTLLNQFPGANNRIEIEFDYYAYAGNGADGIAVNFSDASISPAAGASGGSLGYAQKTGINGFAGGWLGIGIDEYGNFSNSGEGRLGGGSRIPDSISLRGSGSGTSGYPFLTGTNGLSPGIDQGGSTANPGHRYKIIIDHTAGGDKAMVSVQRDTGSGYSILVAEFDVFAINTSQAAVPENWVVSFTGSSGELTNIHEIGDLKVCAAQPIQTFSFIDHYEISHTSPGLTCEGSKVTITVHDTHHDATNVVNDTSISLTTTPTISGTVTSPVTIIAGTSSTSIFLKQTSELLDVDIDVTDGSFGDIEGSSEDPNISFLDAAFRFYADGSHLDITPINSQISGKPTTEAPANQSLELRAVRTNTDTGACEAGLAGSQTVSVAYSCIDSNNCSTAQLSISAEEIKNIPGTDNGTGLTYTNLDMLFDAEGRAPLSFNFPDAGKIQLHASISVAENLPDPAFTLVGNTNEFIVRPFAFDLGFPVNYDSADESGSKFVSAGTPFPMTIRAVNWQSEDDSNNDGFPDVGSDVSNNSVTPNFGQELSTSNQILTITSSLNLPSTGTSGALSATVIKTSASDGFFTAGITEPAASLTWDEVGIINVNVHLDNYLAASGANILGDKNNVGRFYPDYFTLVSSDLSDSCGTFSYMDQPDIDITYTLQAKNIMGDKTEYYTGNFVKMNPSVDINFVSENNNNGGSYQTRVNGFGATNWSGGEYIYSYSGSFSRAALGPDGPYQNLQIGIQLNDNDGNVSLLENLDMRADTIGNCTTLGDCDAKRLDILDNLDLRFGQLKLSNAFGPEAFDLDMAVQTKYYDGTDFVLNTDDYCTVLLDTNPSFFPRATSWTDNLDAGETSPSLHTNITAGKGTFSFSAAELGNEGSVKFVYDTSNSGINGLPWLNTENNDNGDYADNPLGTITFGQYRGSDRIIYWREVMY
jgi:MSHA biogenesis protein MshQ